MTSKQKQFQGVLKRMDSRHETTRNHGERVAVCPALAHNRGNQGKAGSTPATSTNFQGSSSSGKSQTAVRSKGQCKSMAAAPLIPRANTVVVEGPRGRTAANYREVERSVDTTCERPAGSLLNSENKTGAWRSGVAEQTEGRNPGSSLHCLKRVVSVTSSVREGLAGGNPAAPNLFTYETASAQHFGGVVSVQRLRRAVARKELRAVKLGHRTVLFRPVDLDKWAESFAVEAMV